MADWKPEVKNQQHLTIQDDWIVCSATYSGSPINALYSKLTITPPNRYYVEFEFDQIEQSLFVGLTTADAFKSGYELKGMLYGGNLSNGSCLLVGNFGDSIQGSGRVALVVDVTNDEAKVFVIHNERPLGLAFHLQAPYSQPLHPVVQFSGRGRVRVQTKQASQVDHLLQRQEQYTQGLFGNWQINRLIDEKGKQVDLQANYKLKFDRESDTKVRLSVRVVNCVGGILKIDQSNQTFFESEPLFSTLMAGPPEMMTDESIIKQTLHSLNSYCVSVNQQQLTLKGQGELQLSRYIEQIDPYTQDPIRSE